MLKRTITGACYVAVIVGFFMLREFVDPRLMNILTWFFIAVGSFELARMIKPFALKGTFTLSIIYGVVAFFSLVLLAAYYVLVYRKEIIFSFLFFDLSGLFIFGNNLFMSSTY